MAKLVHKKGARKIRGNSSKKPGEFFSACFSPLIPAESFF